MDKKKLLLLAYLSKNCSSNYKVLEIQDIIKSVPKYKGDLDKLSEDIEYLKKLKFIDVKYFDNDNICLCMLDNSEIMKEDIKSNKQKRKVYQIYFFLGMLLCGVSSFVGAFLAILLFR